METLMDVRNLSVTYRRGAGAMQAVRGVSFALGRERLGIVGESGSGKSTIGRALLKLLPTATITAERMDFMGTDLVGASERRMLDIRGARISMILQDPKFSLNPVKRVGDQIAEVYAVHHRGARREARGKALAMLEAVQIRDPERVYKLYPHELSGGQRQRVAIARALVLEPSVLLLGEPTSALDVSVQAEVLNLLADLRAERGLTYLLVSHDLAVIDHMCDRFAIMLHGRIVEVLDRTAIPGNDATDPYARELIGASLEYDRAA